MVFNEKTNKACKCLVIQVDDGVDQTRGVLRIQDKRAQQMQPLSHRSVVAQASSYFFRKDISRRDWRYHRACVNTVFDGRDGPRRKLFCAPGNEPDRASQAAWSDAPARRERARIFP